jgi:hypothetical protein
MRCWDLTQQRRNLPSLRTWSVFLLLLNQKKGEVVAWFLLKIYFSFLNSKIPTAAIAATMTIMMAAPVPTIDIV